MSRMAELAFELEEDAEPNGEEQQRYEEEQELLKADPAYLDWLESLDRQGEYRAQG